MFKFLIFMVFFGFVLLFLLGFSIVRMVKFLLFGSANKGHADSSRQRASGREGSRQSFHKESARPTAVRRKIFVKEEGEYVDYEEVK